MTDYQPETERIREALLAMRSAGDFAATFDVAAMGLTLDVEGVGPCRFPLSAERIAQLLEHAEPSPFGYRDQTLHDESVRKSWEIPGSKVTLDPAAWSTRLRRGLDHIVGELGFPKGVEVDTSLQKLVLYEAGGFFAPHRDTERDPSMWGTIVVVVPSAYRGGEMVVGHAGDNLTFDTASDSAARRLCFVGFYADCVHEIRPVEQGCRVALIFSVHTRSKAARPEPGHQLAVLRSGLEAFFGGGEVWLTLLLDHSYTRQRFGWSELKNLDRARVDAIRRVGLDLNYACFLAFAEVQEWFQFDGEDEDTPVSRANFGAREGGQLELSGWVDEAGSPCVGTTQYAEDPCIVSAVPSLQRHPHSISGEPWSGNEGGTAEQWYHQAAVVLIPQGPLCEEVAKPIQARERKAPRRVVRRRKKSE